MRKITEQELLDYVSEVGEFSKDYRKYSGFYCTVTHTIDHADIKDLKGDGIDASDFHGVLIQRDGTWDDSWGTEWDSTQYMKVTETRTLIPEEVRVIPEHYVSSFKTETFKPVFEE